MLKSKSKSFILRPTEQPNQPSRINLRVVVPNQHQVVLNANYNSEVDGMGTDKNIRIRLLQDIWVLQEIYLENFYKNKVIIQLHVHLEK